MGTQKLHFAPRSPKMGDFELQLFQFVDGNFLTNENFPAGSNLGGQLSFPRCHGITERSWKHYDCLSSVHPPLDVVVAAAARMNVGNFFHRKSYQEGKADMSKCLGLPSLRPLVSADWVNWFMIIVVRFGWHRVVNGSNILFSDVRLCVYRWCCSVKHCVSCHSCGSGEQAAPSSTQCEKCRPGTDVSCLLYPRHRGYCFCWRKQLAFKGIMAKVISTVFF